MIQEIDDLIYRFLDRELDEAGFAELMHWLAEDDANLQHYAILASEAHLLRECTRREAVKPAVIDRAALMRDLLMMEESAKAETVAWSAPVVKPTPHPRPSSGTSDASRRVGQVPAGWLVAGALAMAAVITVVLMVPPQTPQTIAPPPPVTSPPLATAQAVIQSSENVIWGGSTDWTSAPGERLPTGEVQLLEGQMTIRFDGGATVVVTAGSTFRIEDGRSMQLETGQIVVQSSQSSSDFSVTTPRARLIDRNTTGHANDDTAFGICASGQGMQVTVFQGEVDLFGHGAFGEGDVALGQITFLETYDIDGEGQVTSVDYDRAAYQALTDKGVVPRIVNRTLTLQQGVDGYHGTVDTWFSSREAYDEVDGFPEGPYFRVGQWEGVNQQALLRFDDLREAGLPADARVLEATLVLHNARDIIDDFGEYSAAGNPFAVHQMLTAWQAADAFGGTPWSQGQTPLIDLDDKEARVQAESDCRNQVAIDNADVVPAGTRIELDVTAAVTAWASDQPNYGFLLQSLGATPLPEAAEAQAGDSIFIASSEYRTNPSLRPALIITFLDIE